MTKKKKDKIGLKNKIDQLITHYGDLERPVVAENISIPDVIELDGGRLVWQWLATDKSSTEAREVRPGKDMLEGFLQLAGAPDNKILGYARRWGVLALCEHDLPARHNPPPIGMPFPKEGWKPPGCHASQRESLERWKHFSQQALSLLSIAGQLKQGEVGKIEDWSVVLEPSELEFGFERLHSDVRRTRSETARKRVLDYMKWRVCWFLNDWLLMGAVGPIFQWSNDETSIRLGGDGLFGALAIQLMSITTSDLGVAFCSECGGSYIPDRRPRDGENHYCQKCGIRAAWRRAQQRKRMKSAR